MLLLGMHFSCRTQLCTPGGLNSLQGISSKRCRAKQRPKGWTLNSNAHNRYLDLYHALDGWLFYGRPIKSPDLYFSLIQSEKGYVVCWARNRAIELISMIIAEIFCLLFGFQTLHIHNHLLLVGEKGLNGSA